jgi:hypothetical protein
VLRVRSAALPDLDVPGALDELVSIGASGDHERARHALAEAMQALQPDTVATSDASRREVAR